jgi:hypothetical protein
MRETTVLVATPEGAAAVVAAAVGGRRGGGSRRTASKGHEGRGGLIRTAPRGAMRVWQELLPCRCRYR